jgi:hypothetical protein
MTKDDDGRVTYVPGASAVTLSVDARDICRALGLSEIEYAKLLLRLRQAKRDGLIQER